MALPFRTAGLPSSPATRLTAINREVLDARVYDQMFSAATPALKTFMSRVELKDGYNVEYAIRTGDIDGAWRARDGQITAYSTQTGAPATRAVMNKYYINWTLNLADVDVRENRGAAQLVNYVTTQLDILADSMSAEMAAAIWTPQSGNQMYSLVDAIGDSTDAASYAGITLADMTGSGSREVWSSFVMDCGPGTSTNTGVSPSLANHQKMLRVMFDYNGKYPDAVYVTGPVWDKLAAEIAGNDYIAGERGEKNDIEWGVQVLRILGVPVFRDRHLPSNAFVSSGTTRATCKGHASYFVDWSFIHPYATPGRKFQLQEWVSLAPSGYERKWNNIAFDGGVITNRRRAHGKIVNIDPTIAATSYTSGTVYWGGVACN